MENERELAQSADRYRAATAELVAAREQLAENIRAADKNGMRQVDILRATGHVYTREQVRKICREE
jgi:hypothetical protein